MDIVDNAVFVDGRRVGAPGCLEETSGLMRERGGMAWIGLYRPARAEVQSPWPRSSG